jgi:hypothetical protein
MSLNKHSFEFYCASHDSSIFYVHLPRSVTCGIISPQFTASLLTRDINLKSYVLPQLKPLSGIKSFKYEQKQCESTSLSNAPRLPKHLLFARFSSFARFSFC